MMRAYHIIIKLYNTSKLQYDVHVSSCPQNMISNSKPELFVMLKLKGTNTRTTEIPEEISIALHCIRNQYFKP